MMMMKLDTIAFTAVTLFLLSSLLPGVDAEGHTAGGTKYFNRNATWYTCTQIDASCNFDNETVSEILSATTDGMTVLYTDAAQQNIGFADISDIANPMGMGVVSVEGEPTSVVVVNDMYAIAAVNTATDFVNVSGQAVIIDIASMEIIRTIEIGGKKILLFFLATFQLLLLSTN
jgi:hypothetical protein